MKNDLEITPATEHEVASVPYAVYKMEKEHQKRTNRNWLIIVLVLIAAIIGTNLGWIIYESQWEEVTEEITEESYEYEVEQDSENGNNNFIGRDGEIVNGAAENKG